MGLNFDEVNRVTKEFLDKSNERIAERIFGFDPVSGPDSIVVYGTVDGENFIEFGTWPREPKMRNVTTKPKQIKE